MGGDAGRVTRLANDEPLPSGQPITKLQSLQQAIGGLGSIRPARADAATALRRPAPSVPERRMNARTEHLSPTRIFHRHLRETYPVAVAGDGVWITDREGKRYIDASRRRRRLLPRPRPPRRDRGDARADRHARLRAHQLLHHRGRRGAGRASGRATRPPGIEPRLLRLAAARRRSRRRSRWRASTSSRSASRSAAHFIARRQSYHGNTLGALAVGGNAWRREQFAPLLIDVEPRLALLRVSRPRGGETRRAVRRAPGRASSRRRSSASARTASSPSSPRRWSAPRSARAARCPATSGACARSATATACC